MERTYNPPLKTHYEILDELCPKEKRIKIAFAKIDAAKCSEKKIQIINLFLLQAFYQGLLLPWL